MFRHLRAIFIRLTFLLLPSVVASLLDAQEPSNQQRTGSCKQAMHGESSGRQHSTQKQPGVYYGDIGDNKGAAQMFLLSESYGTAFQPSAWPMPMGMTRTGGWRLTERTLQHAFNVSGFTAGYMRDVPLLGGVQTGIGANATAYAVASPFKPYYGDLPWGANVFIRVRLKSNQ